MFGDASTVPSQHPDRHSLVQNGADLVSPRYGQHLWQWADVATVEVQTFHDDEHAGCHRARLRILPKLQHSFNKALPLRFLSI